MPARPLRPAAAGDPAAAHPDAYLIDVQVARFAAAFLVLLGHVQHEVAAGKAGPPAGFAPVTFFDFGVGVDVFFVISGFIMFHLSRDAFGVPGAPRRFLVRRVARVAPLYWFFTTATLLAAAVAPERFTDARFPLGRILASYAFLPAPGPSGPLPVLSLGWTINYEMMFYFTFAAALLLPRAAGLAALAAAFGLAATLHPAAMHADAAALLVWSDPIILEFLLGVGLGVLRGRGVRVGPGSAAALAVAGLAFVAATSWLGWQTGHRFLSNGPGAALIVAAATLTRQRRPATRLERGLAIGGDASYALYLSHPFSIKALSWAWAAAGLEAGWTYVAAACWIAVAASLFVHVTLERAFARWTAPLVARYGTRGGSRHRRPPSSETGEDGRGVAVHGTQRKGLG